MKIATINSVNSGSTGNIMLGIAKVARKHGHEVVTCVPKSRDNLAKNVDQQILIGNRVSRNLHIKLAELMGLHGCFSFFSTIHFIHQLKQEKPDLIHLHNLHGDYINLPLLFRYIKKDDIPVVWTLHDCWAMTGQCPYFTMVKCDKWKTGCNHCPQIHGYPNSHIDSTKWMWKHKKKWFCGVRSMTIVTPSKWLGDLVSISYLENYPVKVINNGINLSVFKPSIGSFRQKNNIGKKFLILGVAASWGKRKGLDVLIDLYSKLDERYQIVLVGTNKDIKLPAGIISISHTNNQAELAEIYTEADLLVNPTREDNFPTVNLESLACGTPVLMFNTGGSPECISEECGAVVECDDIDAMIRHIERIAEKKPYRAEDCIKRAQFFDENQRFEDYIELYESISKTGKTAYEDMR